LYDFRCGNGHTHERLRRYEHRDEPATCLECGESSERIVSAHHTAPDGVYSYSPNLGSPSEHERRYEQAREQGERLGTGGRS
jgi:putative FmdB family regulatory protein